MIVVYGNRSHRAIFGRKEILRFVNWLEDEVYDVKYKVDHKWLTDTSSEEVERVLYMLNDIRKQVYDYACCNTVEFGEALAKAAGITLELPS